MRLQSNYFYVLTFKPKQTEPKKPEHVLKAEHLTFSFNCFKSFQPTKIL